MSIEIPESIEVKPLFPEIHYRRKIDRVELETSVRILRGDKYYTLLFKEVVQFPLGEIVDPDYVAKGYQRLITGVYIAMNFYKFPGSLPPDADQMPEKERLELVYPIFY